MPDAGADPGHDRYNHPLPRRYTATGRVVYDRKPHGFKWRDARRIVSRLDPPRTIEDFAYNVGTTTESAAALAQGVSRMVADMVRRRFSWDLREVIYQLLEVIRSVDPAGYYKDRGKIYDDILRLLNKLA